MGEKTLDMILKTSDMSYFWIPDVIVEDDGVVAGVVQIIVGDSLQEECTVDSGTRAATKVPWAESIVWKGMMY